MGLRNPRIQRGDLVEHTKATPLRAGKAYLVVRTQPGWLMLLGVLIIPGCFAVLIQELH